MKTCRHCNSVESDNRYVCSVCQRALPPAGPSMRTLQKTALTLAIPIVVWVVTTRLLGWYPFANLGPRARAAPAGTDLDLSSPLFLNVDLRQVIAASTIAASPASAPGLSN